MDYIKYKDYDYHQGIYEINDTKLGFKAFIVIHRSGAKGSSFGATRIRDYLNEEEALTDALRLSKGMSYKIAFSGSGSKYGGAKGVIMNSESVKINRVAVLQKYAEHVNALNGKFITGADMNMTIEDLFEMKKKTKYVVGFNSNPERVTGLGLLYALKETLFFLYGTEQVSDRSFAIQGLGKVGTELIHLIYGDAKKIIVTDINLERIKSAVSKFPNLVVVNPSDIYKQKVNVFIPCAVGGIINEKNVSDFECDAVVGAANNQLADENAGYLLFEKEILYAPDYIANSGGLISVIDEYEHGKFDQLRIGKKLLAIRTHLRLIYKKSSDEKVPTNIIAKNITNGLFHIK